MLLTSWRQLAAIRNAGVHCRSLVSEIKTRKQQKIPGKMLDKLKEVMAAANPMEDGYLGEDSKIENKNKRRKKKTEGLSNEIKIPEKMQNYFNEQGQVNFLAQFPEKLLKIKKNPDISLYLASEKSARVIADVIKKDLPKHKPLLEINPGLGLLTKLLINETDNDLLLYENDQHFHPDLTKLIASKDSKRNLKLNKVDLASIWKMAYIDKLDQGNRIDEALKGILRSDYEDDSNARLFNITSSLSFIRHIINSVVFQTSLMAYGRCELYLCLPPPLFIHLTCSNKAGYFLYRSTTILFQILFEYEFICKVNRKDFLPWHSETKDKPSLKLDRFNKIDPDKFYIMRAVPRKDLYEYCSNKNLPSLWFFIKQSLRSRSNRVIPSLENWIPGCGPRLSVTQKPKILPQILKADLDINTLPELVEPCRKLSVEDVVDDMSIFTEFGDLSPSEILTIFNQFSSWPEYKECSFSAALERMLVKWHTNPEEHVGGIDIPEEADEDESKKSEKS